MANAFNIGLDFGSVGWRAAYADGETVTALSLPTEWEYADPWLHCERVGDSLDGIRFPAFKEQLAFASNARGVVSGRFRYLYEAAASQTGRPPGQLVVTAPALYSSANREALRVTALASGFGDVHLLNDSMACAIAHATRHPNASQMLVYCIGYAGFELGLIRASKGRYRAVAYEGGLIPSGADLDTLIARSWFIFLVEHGLWPHSTEYPLPNWLTLRDLSQHAREQLSTDKVSSLALPFEINGLPAILPGVLIRSRLDAVVGPAIDQSLEAAEKLLEDTGLSAADLDAVLLVGGLAAMPRLRQGFEQRFGRPPAVGDSRLLAEGAAYYAAKLGGPLATDTAVVRGMDFNFRSPLTLGLSPAPLGDKPAATTFSVNLRPRETAAPLSTTSLESLLDIRERLFQQARTLIAEGAVEKASGFLQGVTEEAQALLSRMPAQGASKWKLAKALETLNALLDDGRLQQAVEMSHQIYGLDREDALTFRRMQEVHVQAAEAMNTVDGYKKAIEWLSCALDHDKTDRQIRERVAERRLLHASQMAALGRTEEALKAIDECLRDSPDHPGARELSARISAPSVKDVKSG